MNPRSPEFVILKDLVQSPVFKTRKQIVLYLLTFYTILHLYYLEATNFLVDKCVFLVMNIQPHIMPTVVSSI